MSLTLSQFNILVPDAGSAASPTIGFQNSSNSGFFLKSDSVIGISIGGTEVFNFSSSGGSEVGQLILGDGSAVAPSLAWGGASSNTGLYLAATDSLGFSANGTICGSYSSAGLWTFPNQTLFTAATNQIVIQPAGGSAKKFILTGTAPAADSTYTIPDAGTTASFVMNAGASTIAGAKTFSSAIIVSAGVTGTATNDSAASGIVGEYIQASRVKSAATGATSTTTLNVTASALSLTAGDWDVSGCVVFLGAAGTSVTLLKGGISKTTATLPATDTIGVPTAGEVSAQISTAAMVLGANDWSMQMPVCRISLASTTSIFLVANATFSVNTLTVYGSLNARRVR